MQDTKSYQAQQPGSGNETAIDWLTEIGLLDQDEEMVRLTQQGMGALYWLLVLVVQSLEGQHERNARKFRESAKRTIRDMKTLLEQR